MWLSVVFISMVASATGFDISDEQYFEMPHLFHLDDWDECMANRRAAYCVGTFDLLQHRNDRLFGVIKKFSSTKYHFNRTLVHRGYCLPKTCSHIRGTTPRSRFESCVNNLTRSNYGLEANLTELKYCRTKENLRPVDGWDVTFLCIVGLILFANLIGTAYDFLRTSEKKANKLLMAWSVRASWQRLTADYSDGDPRLSALKPVQGMKALTLVCIMLAHSVFAYHLTYLYNPQFLEANGYALPSILLQNGSCIVQTFIMVSSFLFAYNLLIQDKEISWKMLPRSLMHRISRLTPLNLFVIGLATSWWAHASDGPLWRPLVEAESLACRSKWWAQALYVNNFVKTDEKCLIHTWYLAVDMQLYIFSAVLTLLLGRCPRAAVKVLPILIVGALAMNFAIVYHWNYKPMVVLMYPELMRSQYVNEPSFTWLYSAPWGSLAPALIGVYAGFVHHLHQVDGYRPADSMVMRVLCRLSIPMALAWIVGGFWVKDVTDQFWLAVYGTLDRTVFTACITFAMYGYINKMDSACWKLLSWRGWEILGRMSLSIYLVHWLFSLMLLAVRTNTARASAFEIGGHWLSTIFLSYWAALPLHLLVEVPAMKFLQSITS